MRPRFDVAVGAGEIAAPSQIDLQNLHGLLGQGTGQGGLKGAHGGSGLRIFGR